MRALASHALSACSVAALALVGCTHARDSMTFAEAGLWGEADGSAEALEPAGDPSPAGALPPSPDRSAPPAVGSLPEKATLPLRLRWPVDRAGVSSFFGLRRDPFSHSWRMHRGLDLVAPEGRVVGAAAAGFVVHAGWFQGYGLMVEVRHPGGLTTRYSHLALVTCSAGEAVEPGQPLGLVGATGRATGPHLHFEVWRGGQARDPLALLVPASSLRGN